MMWLLFTLIGALVGGIVHHYISTFSAQVKQEVWQAYQVVFADASVEAPSVNSQWKPIRCFPLWCYLLIFIAFSLLCFAWSKNLSHALISLCYVALIFCIARIDFAYQLISTQLCQLLFALGIVAAWRGVTELSVEQSLCSGAIGFVSFYVIYALAKLCYGREALGRGDYWLMLGLASFIPWQQLPLMVFIACLCGLFYGLYQRCRGGVILQIPFAPFLISGEVGLWLLNYF